MLVLEAIRIPETPTREISGRTSISLATRTRTESVRVLFRDCGIISELGDGQTRAEEADRVIATVTTQELPTITEIEISISAIIIIDQLISVTQDIMVIGTSIEVTTLDTTVTLTTIITGLEEIMVTARSVGAWGDGVLVLFSTIAVI